MLEDIWVLILLKVRDVMLNLILGGIPSVSNIRSMSASNRAEIAIADKITIPAAITAAAIGGTSAVTPATASVAVITEVTAEPVMTEPRAIPAPLATTALANVFDHFP